MTEETLPEDAIILPNEDIRYIAIWQTENKLILRLLNVGQAYEYDIRLDKKIIPHLVDALIELQNK